MRNSIDNPLASIDEWDDELLKRYPSSDLSQVSDDTDRFRDYEREARPSVREFYALNHRYQTVDFVRQKRAEYLGLNRRKMGVWEAMEYLNQLVDDSDPDIDLPQIEHLLQTAEAIRADGRPDWFILAGLVHDLGKILCLWNEPQWAVVGDTFPVGCRYSERIVFYRMLEANPDWNNQEYQSQTGIYTSHCGLNNVMLSWGHDEYLFHVVKDYLPPPALAMIRYHSCYPIHRESAYQHLMNDEDHKAMQWVREFNQYDLYTKRDERMDVDALRPFYEELIAEYFPAQIRW
ncbi:MAG TPA: inositol oxygenase [Planctomycetaceae bacterium]|nr:inositol oxygenase [Planctomycetaceae bacterium]